MGWLGLIKSLLSLFGFWSDKKQRDIGAATERGANAEKGAEVQRRMADANARDVKPEDALGKGDF